MKGLCKLILKNDVGTPRGVLTVRCGEREWLRCPSGYKLLLLEMQGETLTCGGSLPPLPRDCDEVSLLGEYLGERVFATTRTGDDAALAKWRLREAADQAREREKVPKSPLREDPKTEETRPPLSPSDGERDETQEEEPTTQTDPEENVDTLSKAKRMLEAGEPFTLFQSLMPGSRWAKIEGTDCQCLIGILEDNGRERVLCGVAGTASCPPDEGKLWTYFPTNDEEGYYLTEYEE